MKCLSNSLGILVLSLSALHVGAVTIHECVDENNEKTYQESCPPGTTSSSTVKLQTGSADKKALPENINITLYMVPNCEACDVTRTVLKQYGANFNEVNIKNNATLQNKLKNIIGAKGKLSVPTVVLGEKQVVGFDKTLLISELESAGFVDQEQAAGEEQDADEDANDTPEE